MLSGAAASDIDLILSIHARPCLMAPYLAVKGSRRMILQQFLIGSSTRARSGHLRAFAVLLASNW